MPCKVCLSPTAGIHYQSLCCRACAAFFRRTVQRKIRYKCGRGGGCDVTYKNRFSCRFCRLKRCVAVGMVMNDEPSTSFDFHFDEDSDTIDGDSLEEQNDDFYSVDNIFGNNEVFIEEFRARILSILKKKYKKPDLPVCLSLCQQIAIANANHKKKWPACRKERLHGGVIDMSRLMCSFFQEMQFTAEFCMEIRVFVELPLDQRNAVFKHFAARYSQMERIFASVDILGRNVDDMRIVSVDGQIVDFFNCKMQLDTISRHTETDLKSVLLSTEKQVNQFFIAPYKRFEADPFETSFLIAFAMWSLDDAEDISHETLEKSKKIRDRLSEELHFYYYYEKEWTNYAKRIYRMHNLLTALDKIVELRKQDGSMAETFQLFKVNIHMTAINEFT